MSVVTKTIFSAGQRIDPAYELLAIDIIKEVNRIPYAQITFLEGDRAQRPFPISDTAVFEPGKEIAIQVRVEGEPGSAMTVFKGLVVKHGVEFDDQNALLTVDLKDAAVKLTQTRKSAVYRQQTDDKIISDVIRKHGLKKGAVAPTLPQHPELVQYYCTDWDFILSRAELHGLVVVVDDGEVAVQKIDLSGSPKHRFEYGISEIDSFEIEVDASHQVANVESVAWDIKTQKLTKASKAKAFHLSQGNLQGDAMAKMLGADTVTLMDPVPLDRNELQDWADAHLARSRLSLLRGRLSVPGLAAIKPLDVIEVRGIGERFNGKTVVTGIRHRMTDLEWLTDIQFGLSAERFVTRDDIVDVPAAGHLPSVHGLQIGIVDQFAADPEKQFRVKVILPGIDEKQGAIWARLASPDAGNGRGYVFWPEPGDEVIVGFFNDDPRQAVILGAMYSTVNPPPQAAAEPTKDNIKKAIVTKTGTTITFDDDTAAVRIATPNANTIVLDDAAQKIHIADQHGNTMTMDQSGITIKSAKDVKIDASGNIEITGKKINVK